MQCRGVAILAYDIGGSTVSAGLVNLDPLGLASPAVSAEIRAAGGFDQIAVDLAGLILGLPAEIAIEGVAAALPGPTDYHSGTSWMAHKLIALRGKSLTSIIGRPDVAHSFVNDADALALGEVHQGAAQGVARVVLVTLGTGIGSAFVIDGRIAEPDALPHRGELWSAPFGDSTIEGRLGRRALEQHYQTLGGRLGDDSLRGIARAARAGDPQARALFDYLASTLAAALRPHLIDFAAERLVLAGAIAESHALFLSRLRAELCVGELASLDVVPAARLSEAALLGAAIDWQRRVSRYGPRRVIYLHGFASSPQSAKAQRFLAAYQQRGHRLELPDLNQNDFFGLTVSRQLELLERITAEDADGSVLLIGSSLGAYTAALFAAQSTKPVALALLAPAFDFHRRWSERLGAAAIERWRAQGEMLVDHYGYKRSLALGWGFITDAARHAPYPDVRQPTLVLHGEHDEQVDVEVARIFARSRPNVELEVLPTDHAMLDQVDWLIERVASFFAPRWR
ncbi:MAG: ROK family protein [Deltaproteobacteria bacterium]|nr:ROK family protein [Deltaproteobacteria bacterium]